MTFNKVLFLVDLALVVVMSLVTSVAFLNDKKKAQNNQGPDRTKESVLLGLTVFNGSIGALIGRLVARHKTDKIYFSIVIYVALFFQVAVACFLGFMAFGHL
jgi:uncharacterized membrane protein YsdA (DUF1294 family)